VGAVEWELDARCCLPTLDNYAVIQLHVPAESELLISGVFERDKRRYIASFPSYIVPQSWKMSGMERYKKIRTLGTSTQP